MRNLLRLLSVVAVLFFTAACGNDLTAPTKSVELELQPFEGSIIYTGVSGYSVYNVMAGYVQDGAIIPELKASSSSSAAVAMTPIVSFDRDASGRKTFRIIVEVRIMKVGEALINVHHASDEAGNRGSTFKVIVDGTNQKG